MAWKRYYFGRWNKWMNKRVKFYCLSAYYQAIDIHDEVSNKSVIPFSLELWITCCTIKVPNTLYFNTEIAQHLYQNVMVLLPVYLVNTHISFNSSTNSVCLLSHIHVLRKSTKLMVYKFRCAIKKNIPSIRYQYRIKIIAKNYFL